MERVKEKQRRDPWRRRRVKMGKRKRTKKAETGTANNGRSINTEGIRVSLKHSALMKWGVEGWSDSHPWCKSTRWTDQRPIFFLPQKKGDFNSSGCRCTERDGQTETKEYAGKKEKTMYKRMHASQSSRYAKAGRLKFVYCGRRTRKELCVKYSEDKVGEHGEPRKPYFYETF